jgi:hypothetical protein
LAITHELNSRISLFRHSCPWLISTQSR